MASSTLQRNVAYKKRDLVRSVYKNLLTLLKEYELKVIYLDNYRGFSNEFIPLNSVNFLVGENSTGKTSFLSSLKVLGSHRFWFRPSFDDPDLNFSSFSEIVSKKSANKKNFTIGFYDSKDEKEDESPNLRLITFKNEEGLPVVHKYSFLSPVGLISTIISDSSLRYKVQEVDEDRVESLVECCMREHSESRPKGYKKFAKEGFPRQLFLQMLTNLLLPIWQEKIC